MEKYLVIFIIVIITLYYIKKYCIESEVDKILINKSIIEKFGTGDTRLGFDTQSAFNVLSDIESSLIQNNNLNILGNIIINNKHKIISDGDTLKIRDLSNQNFLNLVVKDMDVSGILTVKGTSYLNNAIFRSSDNSKQLRILGPNIISENNDLLLSSNTNIIKLGNTIFNGNLSFNNDKKPIISKIIFVNNTSSSINTQVNYEEYSGISFSGYDYSNNRPVASNLQINTNKDFATKNWFITFNNAISDLANGINIRIKLTFFHSNFVQDCSGNGTIPNMYQPYCT
jgi:hypothetical protein